MWERIKAGLKVQKNDPDNRHGKKRERGVALLLVMIVSAILAILGLSLTLSSNTEFWVSSEFESHEKAMAVADAGYNKVKNDLRGLDLTALLSTNTAVPKYIAYTDPAASSYLYRFPVFPLEARVVNFVSPPTAVGTRTENGLLTPPTGTPLGNGRYFAKLTDNEDEVLFGLPDDPTTDMDGKIILRVMGVHMGMPSNVVAYDSARKNSVATIEALLKRDSSFAIHSPFTIYGPNANPAQNRFFDGNSFHVDGYDHTGMTDAQITHAHHHDPTDGGGAGISAVYDDPLIGDAGATTNNVYTGMTSTQYDNIVGQAGPYGSTPSIRDDTTAYRTDPNPDAQNIFSADFVATFVHKLTYAADTLYKGNTTLSGGNVILGTASNPKVTVVTGDLDLSGNGSGHGVLVVMGNLNYSGAFNFDGVVLVTGGSVEFSGANKSLIGGLFVSKLIDNGNGHYSYGTPTFTLGGNTDFYYKSSSIRLALTLLPLRTLSWREITREVEPY